MGPKFPLSSLDPLFKPRDSSIILQSGDSGLLEILLKFWDQIRESSLEGLAEMVAESYNNFNEDLITMDLPGGPGTLDLGRPSGGLWQLVFDSSSAAGLGGMFAIGVLLLIALVYGRQLVDIINLGSAYSSRYSRQRFWTGLLVILFWYWAALVLLHFTQSVTIAILPNMSSFANQITAEIDPKTFYQDPGIVNIDVLLTVFGIGAVAYLALFVLFALREFLIYTLIFVGPIGIALSFSGIPVVEDYARNAMSRFVPLVLLPIPAAVVFRAMSFFLDNLSGTAITQLKIGVELMIGAAPLVALYLCWKSFKLTNPLVGGLVDSTASVATGGIKKTGRGAAAVGATATLGPAAGLATAAGGVKGGARHQALRMGMSGRRRDPEAADDGQDGHPEDHGVGRNPSPTRGGGAGRSNGGASRPSASQTRGSASGVASVSGTRMEQTQLPSGDSTNGLPPGESDGGDGGSADSDFEGAADRRLEDDTRGGPQTARENSTGETSSPSPSRPRYRGRQSQGVYYDPDHGIRKGPRPPEQRGAAGARSSRGVDTDQDDQRGSGRRGTVGPTDQSSQQAQVDILRAIRANLEQQSSEQGGRDVVDVDSRVVDTDTGGGSRDDDTDSTSRGA